MKRNHGLLALGLFFALGVQNSPALVFSLDATSAAANSVNAADLLQSFGSDAAGISAFSTLATYDSLGLDIGDNIDALHFGAPTAVIQWFSVDAASTGAAGTAVRQQADLNEQAADVFATPPLGTAPHSLAADEQTLGLVAAANIDALHWSFLDVENFFFSLSAGSPTLTSIGATAADILWHNANGNEIWMTAADLGLAAGDDLDALDGDGSAGTRFSLAPGSSSLGGGTSGDYFILGNTRAIMSGLNGTDNVDALTGTFDCSLDVYDDCRVPAPDTMILFGLGLALAGLLCTRRRLTG